MEGEWEKGRGRVGERWRESGRKVEGQWEKGGGRVGERWKESGRKVEGDWEKGGGRVGEKEIGRKERREQEHKHLKNENIPQCHTNGGSILVLL